MAKSVKKKSSLQEAARLVAVEHGRMEGHWRDFAAQVNSTPRRDGCRGMARSERDAMIIGHRSGHGVLVALYILSGSNLHGGGSARSKKTIKVCLVI